MITYIISPRKGTPIPTKKHEKHVQTCLSCCIVFMDNGGYNLPTYICQLLFIPPATTA